MPTLTTNGDLSGWSGAPIFSFKEDVDGSDTTVEAYCEVVWMVEEMAKVLPEQRYWKLVEMTLDVEDDVYANEEVTS
jgi:hypothetical protein